VNEDELFIMFLQNLITTLAPLVTGLVVSGFILLGPVGRAIGEVIRRRLGGAPPPGIEPSRESAEIIARLEEISGHVGEIASRQDFAERLLVGAAPGGSLPGAAGREG
jgi:hypothetical protein